MLRTMIYRLIVFSMALALVAATQTQHQHSWFAAHGLPLGARNKMTIINMKPETRQLCIRMLVIQTLWPSECRMLMEACRCRYAAWNVRGQHWQQCAMCRVSFGFSVDVVQRPMKYQKSNTHTNMHFDQRKFRSSHTFFFIGSLGCYYLQTLSKETAAESD
jgi:hypothetical protein